MSAMDVRKMHHVEGAVHNEKYLAVSENYVGPSLEESERPMLNLLFKKMAPTSICIESKDWIHANNISLLNWPFNSPDFSSDIFKSSSCRNLASAVFPYSGYIGMIQNE